jgi:hypothetical protein
MKKYFSTADIVVIAITFILFAAALFAKGFTNALLLEAGVLLVSVKIIMMNFKCSQTNKQILEKLQELDEDIKTQAK